MSVQYVREGRGWLFLLAFVVGGAAIGLAAPSIRAFAGNHLSRSGMGVAYVVNILMPLLIATLTAAYPRARIAVPGGVLATLAFVAALASPIPIPGAAFWTNMVRTMPPVLVVACALYPVVGIITLFAVQPWRRVGRSPDATACPQCGYSLIGLTEPRCPECFRAVDLNRIRAAIDAAVENTA